MNDHDWQSLAKYSSAGPPPWVDAFVQKENIDLAELDFLQFICTSLVDPPVQVPKGTFPELN